MKDNEKHLSALHIYPVKSLKGLSLQNVMVDAKGPLMDRRFMVVDNEGRFLSQRQHPKMCLIGTELLPGKLLLRAPKQPPLLSIKMINFSNGRIRSRIKKR